MPKQHKIKRYRQYGGGNSFRAKPHPITVVLGVAALVALVVLGVFIYQPVYDLITGNYSSAEREPSQPDLPLESEPEADAASEPEEPPAPSPTTGLRAVYMPHDTAIDPAARDAFLASLDGTEINAVMIDIKNSAGNVLFNTANAQAAAWDTVAVNPLDLGSFADTLEGKGYALVARMSAFRDPLAARAGRENAVTYQNSEMLWLDAAPENNGKPWLNPYAPGAADYLTALAQEAARSGARMIVLDDCQFPPYSESNATFGASAEGTRSEALGRFVESFSRQLLDEGVRTAVYFPAVTLIQEGENAIRYGGDPLDLPLENIVIGALPSQFDGDFEAGGLVVKDPAADPAGVTQSVLEFLDADYPDLEGAVLPLLHGAAPTPAQVTGQIDAAKAKGLQEYILYSAAGSYALGE